MYGIGIRLFLLFSYLPLSKKRRFYVFWKGGWGVRICFLPILPQSPRPREKSVVQNNRFGIWDKFHNLLFTISLIIKVVKGYIKHLRSTFRILPTWHA